MSAPNWQPPQQPQPPQNRRSRLTVLGVTGMVVLVIVGVTCLALAWRESSGGTATTADGGTSKAGSGDRDRPGGKEGPGDSGGTGAGGEKAKGGEPKGLVGGYQDPEGKKGRGVGTGSANAKVVVELYEDFSCPHCGKFEEAGASRVLRAKVASGQVRVVRYPVTLGSFEDGGYGNDKAASAYLCAVDQGKGDAYAEKLWNEQAAREGRWTEADLVPWGVDIVGEGFADCLKELRYNAYLDAVDDAMTGKGISGTPGILVNGKPITLDLDAAKSVQAMEKAIDSAAAGR